MPLFGATSVSYLTWRFGLINLIASLFAVACASSLRAHAAADEFAAATALAGFGEPAAVVAQAPAPAVAPAPLGAPAIQISPGVPFVPPIQILPGVQIAPAAPTAPPGYAVPGQAVVAPTPPPAPKPTVAEMSFFVGSGINPDLSGRPYPVIVRTYELKSLMAFNWDKLWRHKAVQPRLQLYLRPLLAPSNSLRPSTR